MIKRIFFGNINGVAIALIPLIYLAINPSLGQNQAGDIDTWFYFGLAKSFWHRLGHDFYNDYYETRLPYIIPAALIFAIPGERIASLILSYLVYCTCAFSLFYVLCKHISTPTALLATMLMASDFFFMRAVGWQYVDGGVLAYGSLTFAALTAAAASRHRYALTALSGFFYASMVIVHIGSAPLGIALTGYALLIFDVGKLGRKECFRLLCYALLGIVVCQAVYGLLNMYLYNAHFFFEDQQVAAGTYTQKFPPALWLPLDRIFSIGWWLTLHIAVWAAAAIMIIAQIAQKYRPNAFQSCCMWSVFVTYSILFAFDYFHVSLFLGRDGLYVTAYLLLSYLFIGSILPSVSRFSVALMVGGLFFVSLGARFEFRDVLANWWASAAPWLSAPWLAGLLLGMFVAGVWLIRNRVALAFVVVAAAVLTLPITWPFRYEHSIYAAREVVAGIVGDALPYFAFSDTDPIYEPVVIGLVGSFSPRAWWLRCMDFPNCLGRFIGPRTVIVPSSTPDSSEVARIVSSVAPEAILSHASRIDRPEQDVYVYSFNISRSPLVMPATKLPSSVGLIKASVRVAPEGTDAGYLTYGPYATLNPGRYGVTVKYEAEGESGSWDVVSTAGILAKGSIPDTRGAAAEIAVTVDLPDGADDFEVRMFYSGHGSLAVVSLSITPLNPATATP
jgi:hypothetical protein